MAVVDWEMVRRGCGATDAGQFAAEAWLLERFHGEKGLLGAFLGGNRDGGREEGGVGRGKGVGGEGGGADGGAFRVLAESSAMGHEGEDEGGGGAWE